MLWIYRTSLGQDHHRFVTSPDQAHEEKTDDDAIFTQEPPTARPLILAGVEVPGPALAGNSDADVVLHAICNAISGVSGINFLGPPADKLCNEGVTNSEIYVTEALQDLYRVRPGCEIVHVSVSLEGRRPKLWDHIPKMKENIGRLLGIPIKDIGITATTGEGLTGMGRGEGMGCLVVLTIREPENTPLE